MTQVKKHIPRRTTVARKRRECLDREAAEFFALDTNCADPGDAAERCAYHEASIRSLLRDEG